MPQDAPARDASVAPGEESDLFVAMRRRRMHRDFLPTQVDAGLMERLVYAASRGPTARADLRHIVVTQDPRLISSIKQVAPGWLNNAPAMIAICTDTAKADELIGPSADKATILDSGAAAGYVSLAAPVLGLGICFTTSWPSQAIQGVLDLPDHIRPDVLLAVGYPVPHPQKAPARFRPTVHHDRFGQVTPS